MIWQTLFQKLRCLGIISPLPIASCVCGGMPLKSRRKLFVIMFIWEYTHTHTHTHTHTCFGCTGPSEVCGRFVAAHRAFASCSAWAPVCSGSVVVAEYDGLSCPVKDQTHIPCIGRWILNHSNNREFRQCICVLRILEWECNIYVKINLLSCNKLELFSF